MNKYNFRSDAIAYVLRGIDSFDDLSYQQQDNLIESAIDDLDVSDKVDLFMDLLINHEEYISLILKAHLNEYNSNELMGYIHKNKQSLAHELNDTAFRHRLTDKYDDIYAEYHEEYSLGCNVMRRGQDSEIY